MYPSTDLTFRHQAIETESNAFGELRASNDRLDDVEELRRRFDRDGYLYLPGLLNQVELLAARHEMLIRLDKKGYLNPAHPLMEGIARGELTASAMFMSELGIKNVPLHKVLYDGPMIAFYERFLGGPVRHFDYTWCRVKSSSIDGATKPHCDIVFMGRGTKQLYTSWTPLSDVPKEMGGLMILENSHKQEQIKSTYGQLDVDAYCTNYPDAAEIKSGQKRWQRVGGGTYSNDAIVLRRELGSRWLTTDYQLGDLLIFGMYTMHASLDNQTNRLRLSTDTRYQLASEPVDERWIGENPIAHGPAAKKGMIC
ncbi:phytanoyl-CoA dioxygenase family protein [Chloroflexi bacterium TSY]|nr:phytanoyl-CoA dioxygenase family protein [Chloroflexi bacterium TSY]